MTPKLKLATRAASAPQLKTLPWANLVSHPDQQRYFRGYGAFKYEQLKADIAANGVKVPPEVLPPGNAALLPSWTIIKGHTRSKIWKELGNDAIRVLVRYDLQNVERAIIDEEFLKDNITRRQQDKLGQARATVGLYLIEREKKGRSVFGDALREGEVRERVGRIVDMSGRNLNRYLNVLSAPAEVQDKFAAGRVRLVDAARVVTLDKRQQEQLAARLRAGEEPKVVFAAFFPKGDGKHKNPNDALAAFARSLAAAGADLGGRIDAVGVGVLRQHAAELKRGRKLIRTLLERLSADG